MKNQNSLINLALSAMFLALAFVMPFMTGQIPQIGKMLCPMHFPVILCGFICGAPWGLAVGFIAPILRSMVLGMPVFFPNALSMAFELAAYGLISAILYKTFPKKNIYIYCSLLISMLLGRLVWGAVQFICMGLDTSAFGFEAFWTGAVINSVPGIILQILLIPVIVMLAKKAKLLSGRRR